VHTPEEHPDFVGYRCQQHPWDPTYMAAPHPAGIASWLYHGIESAYMDVKAIFSAFPPELQERLRAIPEEAAWQIDDILMDEESLRLLWTTLEKPLGGPHHTPVFPDDLDKTPTQQEYYGAHCYAIFLPREAILEAWVDDNVSGGGRLYLIDLSVAQPQVIPIQSERHYVWGNPPLAPGKQAQLLRLLEDGETVRDAAKIVGIANSTAHRYGKAAGLVKDVYRAPQELIDVLGTDYDHIVAADWSMTQSAVRALRRRQKPPIPGYVPKEMPSDEELIPWFLRKTDAEIAGMYGISGSWVSSRRRALGYPRIQGGLTPEREKVVREAKTLAAAAKKLGVHKATISKWRKQLGISRPHGKPEIPIPPEVLPLLGVKKIAEIVALTGYSKSRVQRWRKQVGALSVREQERIRMRTLRERAREMYATNRDIVISKELGVDPSTISRWRREDGVAPHRKWPTAQELPLWVRQAISTLPDEQLAKRLSQEPEYQGINRAIIDAWRTELAKDAYTQQWRTRLRKAILPWLSRVPDTVLAEVHNVKEETIAGIRNQEGIPAWSPTRVKLPLQTVLTLNTMPARKLAERLGEHVENVVWWRRQYGIPRYEQVNLPRWIAHALGTDYDRIIAQRFGVAIPAVTQWREELGIRPYNDEEPQVFPDMQTGPVSSTGPVDTLSPALVAILGTEPASVIAAQQGVSVEQAEQWHLDRGIPLFKQATVAPEVLHAELEELFDAGYTNEEISEYTGLHIETVREERDELRPLSAAIRLAFATGATDAQIASKQGFTPSQVAIWREQWYGVKD